MAFVLGLGHGSLGVGEMNTQTAAELLGWDPKSLTDEQRSQIEAMLNNPVEALILTALYLDKFKQENPDASIVALGSAYNSGSLGGMTDVGRRSGYYLGDIEKALSSGNASGPAVIRCKGGYHFENQCN